MEDFPPNSKASKGREREPVQRVTSEAAVRRKPSLGKKFMQTFIVGDSPRAAWDYMVWEAALPAIRDGLIETLQGGIERLFNGGAPRRRGAPGPNPYGYVNYGQYSRSPRDDRPPIPMRRQVSRPSKARFNFDEIILQTRADAEEVLSQMYNILDSQYEEVTVADLYELSGLEPSHVDTTWGWTDLRGAGVGRVRGLGYVLDLPEPEYLR